MKALSVKLLKKAISVGLILLTLNLYLFPAVTFAEEERLFAEVTKHPPEFLSTPEEPIPTVKGKKTSGWTWIILAVLVGGVAAAAAGGGGGGGGDGDGGSSTGSVTVGW